MARETPPCGKEALPQWEEAPPRRYEAHPCRDDVVYHGSIMNTTSSSRDLLREIIPYGVCGGILIAVLRLAEVRFLVLEHRAEIYGAIVAVLFAGLGIWLGGTLTRKKPEVVVREVRVDGPFVVDEDRVRELQLTPRELEVLGLIARGLSNKEIAEQVFVSENTVKTHASRVFGKLGARRRTEAVQLGKTWGLIP
ncbi:MAG: response regulator transcription factor [Candidatus Eisenbacteria bacterium]